MAVDLFNRHFDFPVLLAIREAFESGTWDGWMRAVTALGDHGVVWIALTLVALVGNMGLKPLFDRLRPCDIMGFTLLPACPPDPSFPFPRAIRPPPLRRPPCCGCAARPSSSPPSCWRLSSPSPASISSCTSRRTSWRASCSDSAAPGAPRGALNSSPAGAADASSNRTAHDEKGPHPRGMRTDRAV